MPDRRATCFGVVPHEIGARSQPAALAAQSGAGTHLGLAQPPRFATMATTSLRDTQAGTYGDPRQGGAAVRGAFKATQGPGYQLWERTDSRRCITPPIGGISLVEEVWSGEARPYLCGDRPDGPSAFAQLRRSLLASDPDAGLLRPGRAAPMGATAPRFWLGTKGSSLAPRLARISSQRRPSIGTPARSRSWSGRADAAGGALAVEGARERVLRLRCDPVRNFRQLPSTCSSWF